MNIWHITNVESSIKRGRVVFDNLNTISESGMKLELSRREFVDLNAYMEEMGCTWNLTHFKGRKIEIV